MNLDEAVNDGHHHHYHMMMVIIIIIANKIVIIIINWTIALLYMWPPTIDMISGIQYPFDIVGSTDCCRPNVFVASQSSINGKNGHDDDDHHHHYLVTLCQRHCQSDWFLWTLTTDSIAEVANMFSSKKSAFSANRIKAQHLSWVFSLYVCIVLAKSWPHVIIKK